MTDNDKIVDVDDYLHLQSKVVSMTESIVHLSKVISSQGSDIMHMLSMQEGLINRAQDSEHDFKLLAERFKKCPKKELKFVDEPPLKDDSNEW